MFICVKLMATVKFVFICLFQNDLLCPFRSVVKLSSPVSSSMELECAIYVAG